MTRTEVITMAMWAGYPHAGLSRNTQEQDFLIRFAALITAIELEACARVCESEWTTDAERAFGSELAALIRARSTE